MKQPKRHKNDLNAASGRFELPLAYAGRTYTLFKKGTQSADAPWYLRVTRKGKEIWRSCETNDAETARNKAAAHLELIFNGDQIARDAAKLRGAIKYATLGQICALYLQLSKVLNPKDPVSRLLCIVRKALGLDALADVAVLSVEILTGKLVRDYQGLAIKSVRDQKHLEVVEYRDALGRAQGTANSTWRQARAVFIPEMMAQYRDAGLHFPADFERDFVAAPKIKGAKAPMYSQPQDSLIARTLEGHRRLMERAVASGFTAGRARATERAVAIALELGAGLRAGEVRAARGFWCGEVNGRWVITIPGNAAKNKKPSHERLPAEFEEFVRAYIAARGIGPNDRLIGGHNTIRSVSRWLRLLGWTGSKTNHALRKYFGFRIATQYGIGVAQRRLRHANVSTTQMSYTGLLNGDDAVVSFSAPAPGQIVAMPAADLARV